MGIGKTTIKQSEVMRAARGLLEAAKATGTIGDIEVHLETKVVKFHMAATALPSLTTLETFDDTRKLL